MNPLTTPWLEATIIGFAYLVSLTIILLLFSGKAKLHITAQIKDVIPYFAVVILFSSYVVGLSTHLLMQEFILKFFQDSTTPLIKISEFRQNLPEKEFLVLQNNFAILIMYRHLIISFVLLTVFTPILLFERFENKKVKWSVFSVLFLITILFGSSYLIQRTAVNSIKFEMATKVKLLNAK
jgi:hypothetical protein